MIVKFSPHCMFFYMFLFIFLTYSNILAICINIAYIQKILNLFIDTFHMIMNGRKSHFWSQPIDKVAKSN